jgi:uncharacterized membrane protein YebE (DUF533 family)
MFDTRDLLGAMLGTGMGGRNPRMGGLGGMLGGGGMPGGGLGGMLGGGGGMPGGLGGMLGGGGMGGLGGGGLGGMLGGGGGMGGMGRGGGMGGGLQGALIGMLGGVAMSALQRRMMQGAAGGGSARADELPPESGFGRRTTTTAASDYDARPGSSSSMRGSDPNASSVGGGEAPELDEGRAQLLVRVMIAAANADMQIDQEERSRIMGKLEEAGANDAARQFVESEMRRPMSIDEIAREAHSPDLAAQAYASALAAIDVDKAMERRFLQTLAQKLQLDDEIVGEIHDQLGHPRLAA